jgi:hypothetical protein
MRRRSAALAAMTDRSDRRSPSTRYVSGLVVAWIIGCAAVPLARGQASARPGYVHLGEGLSSAAPDVHIEVSAPRMFTIYQLDEACRTSRAANVVRLRAQPARFTLHVGEPFSLKSLNISALDASAALRPSVPIAIELKSASGGLLPVFDNRQDGIVIATPPSVLVPLTAARVTFRARALCPGPMAEAFVEAEIRPR